ncbi:MAG: arginine--tRNA ligase [Caldiserica bacterium]|jgi:arginyl-tRNA synthetase|nr:arginine--tRNA ligase [Caldisericota bacterium]MDH7562755.1 arginine--tRNA ligase [Caldisericota bacterium]
MYFLERLGAHLRSTLLQLFDLDLEPLWEKGGKFADFSTNIAFQASKKLRRNPLEIAASLLEEIQSSFSSQVEVQVAPPGFLNFSLKNQGALEVLLEVFEMGEGYGSWRFGKGTPVNIEFCSANPTGPIHLGNARGACLGHVLSNLWEASGYKVTREYYFDDVGTQVDAFILSIEARLREHFGLPFQFPENGYFGDYVRKIAQDIASHYGREILEWDESSRLKILREEGLRIMQKQHQETLSNLGIEFDVWFSQSSLKEGWLDKALQILEENGFLYQKEGALWFASSKLGDDKDRVVIRSNGEPTYFAWDIAYNLNKVSRGFEIIIDIWGPDHHGYVLRNKAAFQALGFDPEKLILLIYQMVKLFEGGEEVSMSKRTGEFLTLDDVVESVGKDATIFFLINTGMDSNLDFNLDLARERTMENPVFYIQYAYTRALSIEREAQGKGKVLPSLENIQFLFNPQERKLISLLSLMPQEVLRSALTMTPLKLVNFSRDLAGAFHSYYHDYRVLGVEEEVEISRLALVKAIKQVIFNILRLLGLSAPEKM